MNYGIKQVTCGKSVFVYQVRQRKRIWTSIKDRLTSPGASIQWAGRARDTGQILSSVIGGEREEHQSPWCAAAIQSWHALLASKKCNNTKTQNTTTNSTYLQWWKGWQCECKRGERRSDGESSDWSEFKPSTVVFLSSHMEWGMCFLSTCFWNNKSCGHYS